MKRQVLCQCPQCGSRNVAELVYGFVLPDEALRAKIDAGQIALGGCCVDERYLRECNDCGHRFGRPRKRR